MVERKQDDLRLVKIGQLLLEKGNYQEEIIPQEKNLYIVEVKNYLVEKTGYQFDI